MNLTDRVAFYGLQILIGLRFTHQGMKYGDT